MAEAFLRHPDWVLGDLSRIFSDTPFSPYTHPTGQGQESAGGLRAYITGQESDNFHPVIRAVFTKERCSQFTSLFPRYQHARRPSALAEPLVLLSATAIIFKL